MSNSDWRVVGQDLVRRISDRYSVSFATRNLTELLTRYDFDHATDTAGLSLIVSPFDVIIKFGENDDRIELPSLPGSESRLMEIVNAIAAGELVDTMRKRFARYRLTLSDGTIIRGGSMSGVPLGPRVRTYKPW
jgi:hypothetical protein